jgi:hypothetical protein
MTTLKNAIPDDPDYDYEKLNRYILCFLHLDQLMDDVLTDMTEECKTRGLYRQNVKYHLNAIRRVLKKGPNNDWSKLEDKAADDFCEDADKLEAMVYSIFGLKYRGQQGFVYVPEYSIGDKVTMMLNEKKVKATIIASSCKIEVKESGNEMKAGCTVKLKHNGAVMEIGEDDVQSIEK